MDIKQIISKIDSLELEIDKLRPLKQEQERRLIQKFRLDWNFHSSNIEGNTLSYGETKALLLWEITAGGKPIKDHIEMKGHNEAVKYIYEIVKEKNRPFTELFIREMHEVLLPAAYEIDAITPDGKPTKKKVTPGKYKSEPNHVKTKDGSFFYFASPEETPSKMKDLMEWFKKNNEKEHPLITAATFHYKFVLIHPFDDGNGRMARILMNFIFMMHGLPPAIIRTERKENYLLSLALADAGDLEKFIEYIGEQEIASFELVLKAAKGERIEEIEDIDKKVKILKEKMKGIVLHQELTSTVFKDIFEKSIKPFYVKLFENLAKFNDLFKEINFYYDLGGNNTQLKVLPVEFLPVFLDKCYDVIEKKGVIQGIKTTYNYVDLKKTEIGPYIAKILVMVSFEEYGYQISIYSKEPMLISLTEMKKLYHQQLTEEEIKDAIIELTNYIYNKIVTNLKNNSTED